MQHETNRPEFSLSVEITGTRGVLKCAGNLESCQCLRSLVDTCKGTCAPGRVRVLLMGLADAGCEEVTVDLSDVNVVHADVYAELALACRPKADGGLGLRVRVAGLDARQHRQPPHRLACLGIGEMFGAMPVAGALGGEAPAEDVLRRAHRRALSGELAPADLPRVPKRSASEAASLCVERIRE